LVASGSQQIQGQNSSGLFIMPIWVYILQSESTGRHYCGQTSDIDRRVRQHNDPSYQLSKTTKRFEGPWKLVRIQECIDRSEATKLERLVKKRGISRYLDDLNRQSPASGGINH
jgi:putative endonuclease